MVHITKWQYAIIALVCALGIAFASPNLFSEKSVQEFPGFVPQKQISLGLDLQGGAYLLLRADIAGLVAERMEVTENDVRKWLREAEPKRIRFAGMQARKDEVRFRVTDATQVDAAQRLLRDRLANQSGIAGVFGGEPDFEIERLDGNRFRIKYSDAGFTRLKNRTMDQLIEVIRKRIDPQGTRDVLLQRQGDDRILLQAPGEDNPERLKRSLNKTAKLTFHMVDEQARHVKGERPRPRHVLLQYQDETDQYLMVERFAPITGTDLVNAEQGYRDGAAVINFRLSQAGARKFAQITARNVNRRFAIVLDGKVLSAPVIRTPILGGAGEISGGFTIQSAQELALFLNAGALPAKLEVIEERTVGASLGSDSIEAGSFASVLGLVLVIGFMALAYGRFGLMANVALLTNMILIAGALSLLQATLTLPGIAGIVLTIGMAVDANVLIFERIREEARNGRTPISAVDAGYRRAITTIIDSNLTTFIAALMLFFFGSGPVKGFAVTLAIGLATSMFTAIMITRILLVGWLRRTRPATLAI